MANGARVLAVLWDSAWTVGNGKAIAESTLVAIECWALRELGAPVSSDVGRRLISRLDEEPPRPV